MNTKLIAGSVLFMATMLGELAAQVADPPEMVRLRSSYEAAVSRTMRPLTETYISELTKVKDSYTKAGKLDEAVRVDTEIKVMKERLGAYEPLRTSPGSSGSSPTTASKVARVTIPANNPNGYRIGAVKRGDTITLQYVEGMWKDHGGIATANPDDPKVDGGEENRLVIAQAAVNGTPGDLIKVVPGDTRKEAFVYVFQTSREEVVLRINANSDRKQNPGSVVYSMTLKRGN